MNKAHFTHYELVQWRKVQTWQRQMAKPQSGTSHFSKKIQTKINKLIPQKIHDGLTLLIRKMVETVLFTSEFVKPPVLLSSSMESREMAIAQRMEYYRTTAAAKGGITGWGGFLAALADFPALLTIKLKFLFDIAAMYGYDTSKLSERIYLLHVFQLAFPSPVRKANTLTHLSVWATFPESLPVSTIDFDWYQFQQDYRDYLDLAKLLQMVPGIGAGVGLVVNYKLLSQLYDTATMCYRMRWLSDHSRSYSVVSGD